MKNKSLIIGIVLVVLGIALFFYSPSSELPASEESVTYMDLSVSEAKSLIDSNPDLIVLDVSPNYADGHLPGAINYYFGDGSLDDAIASGELDPNAEYLVYCHVDSASRIGAQKLIDAGFTKVYRLTDHYSGWVAAGYEIEQ